jgi:hypothetical protein
MGIASGSDLGTLWETAREPPGFTFRWGIPQGESEFAPGERFDPGPPDLVGRAFTEPTVEVRTGVNCLSYLGCK